MSAQVESNLKNVKLLLLYVIQVTVKNIIKLLNKSKAYTARNAESFQIAV